LRGWRLTSSRPIVDGVFGLAQALAVVAGSGAAPGRGDGRRGAGGAAFTLWEALTVSTPPFSWAAVGLVVLGAVLPGVLSYTAYSLLQRELGASRTALLLYLSPVYAALGAWWAPGGRWERCRAGTKRWARR